MTPATLRDLQPTDLQQNGAYLGVNSSLDPRRLHGEMHEREHIPAHGRLHTVTSSSVVRLLARLVLPSPIASARSVIRCGYAHS